jgi:hypothetical protein
MSEHPDRTAEPPPADDTVRQAAGEAAQHVVDEVTSWNYSAERGTVEAELDDGLGEAGVRLPREERERVLDEIDEVKQDEGHGAPQVRSAEVADGTDPAGEG